MKRILSLLMTVSIIFAMVVSTASSAETTEAPTSSPAVEFLSKLGVIDLASESMLDVVVTREDFAVYIAELIGIDTSARAEVRYFEDIAMTSYGAYAVSRLVECNVLSKADDNKFRPDDPITLGEATKMLCQVTGFGKYAEVRGGFPTGYIRAARENKFLISPVDENSLSVTDVSEMIYAASQINMYEPVSYSSEGVAEYSGTTDCTLLSLYHNIYFDEGLITGVYGRTINSGEAPKEGKMCIDGVEFDADTSVNTDENLGEYVKYFYRKINKNDTSNVIFVESISKEESVKFSIDDMGEFSETDISYYKEINSIDKKFTEKLVNPVIVYNGYPVKTGIDYLFNNLNKGYVTLKDTDNKSGFDLVLIDDYYTIVVSGIDTAAQAVYNKVYKGDYVKCEEYSNVKIYDSSMNYISFSDLKVGDVLSVAKTYNGKELVTIICSTAQMNGTLNSYKSKNPTTVDITGKEYTVDKNYADDFMAETCLGTNYYYSFDIFNDIVYVSEESTDSMKFGYVLNAVLTSEGFGYTANIKMFTDDAKISSMKLADNVRIDGKKFNGEGDKAFTAFFLSNNGSFREMMVRYILDESGFIKDVDTPYLNPEYETEKNSLTYVYEDEFVERYSRANRYGLKAYFNADTKIFRLPAKSVFSELEERELKVQQGTSFGNDAYCTCMVYTTNVMNEYTSVIVDKYDYADLTRNYISQPTFLVKEIKQGLDKDGDVANVLCGYLNGTYKEYTLDNRIKLGDVGQGDLLKLHFDLNEEIIPSYSESLEDVIVLYDYSKWQGGRPDDSTVWKGMEDGGRCYLNLGSADTEYYSHLMQLSFGYANEKAGSMLKFGYRSGADYDEMFRTSSVNVVVYDKSLPENQRVYVGSINDINDYKSVGDDCSTVLVHTRHCDPMSLIVYK